MSAALNNITAPAQYTAASTLSCPGTARVRLQVNNAAIFWQRGKQPPGGGGVGYFEPEEFLLPGLYSFDEVCDTIRVRAAVAGTSPQVTITTRTEQELS